jgi:hypothetical protein
VPQTNDVYRHFEQLAHVPDLMHPRVPSVGDEEDIARQHLLVDEALSHADDLRALENIGNSKVEKGTSRRRLRSHFAFDRDYLHARSSIRSSLSQLGG